MQTKYLVFGSPLIEEEEIQEEVETLRSGWIGTGPKVARFEEMFKKHVGSKHAVAIGDRTVYNVRKKFNLPFGSSYHCFGPTGKIRRHKRV